MKKKTSLLLVLASAFLLAGCSTNNQTVTESNKELLDYLPSFLQPYRPPVTQGNLVTREMLAQLEVGMTPGQVQFVLGTPLLRDQFHPLRWEYAYYFLPSRGTPQIRRLAVWFNNQGRVDHWVSDPLPSETQADELILGLIKTFTPENGEILDGNAKTAPVEPVPAQPAPAATTTEAIESGITK